MIKLIPMKNTCFSTVNGLIFFMTDANLLFTI
jgi:hypothetical protein